MGHIPDGTLALEFFGDKKEHVEKAYVVFDILAKMETWLKEYECARASVRVFTTHMLSF